MGIKINDKKVLQAKMNGKFLWSGKHDGSKIWSNSKFPGVPVLIQQTVPNVLQNNSDNNTEARTWSCTPFSVENSDALDIISETWSIVSHSGFPATPTINAATGVMSCSCPAVNNVGGTVSFKVRYELKTRHGNVAVEAPTITKNRVVAPALSGGAGYSALTIGTAITAFTRTITGSNIESASSTLCSGLIMTKATDNRSITVSGTPTSVDWAATNGVGISQNINVTNEAGADSIVWETERRLFWNNMQDGETYAFLEGAKFGITAAKVLPIANVTELLDVYNNDRPTRNQGAFLYFSAGYGEVVETLSLNSAQILPIGHYAYRLICYTGERVDSVQGNWGYYSPGSGIRIPSTNLIQTPSNSLSGSLTTIVGSAVSATDNTTVQVSKGRKTKINAWLNDILYITG